MAGMTGDEARALLADAVALLDQLDAAREKATPGPWRRNSQPGVIFGDGADRPMPIAAGYTRPDAALIVAAVNALPRLIAALRAVDRIAAARAADELDAVAKWGETRTGIPQWGLRIRDRAAALRAGGTG